MRVVCGNCGDLISEVGPESEAEITGICPECFTKVTAARGITPASIPGKLGSCNILKVQEDGELTVTCGGKKYILQPDGEIFAPTVEFNEIPEPSPVGISAEPFGVNEEV